MISAWMSGDLRLCSYLLCTFDLLIAVSSDFYSYLRIRLVSMGFEDWFGFTISCK